MGPQVLKRIPAEDRPRERLLRSGGDALSDAELLAVLLRTGTRGATAIDLGHRLIREHGGLVGLLTTPTGHLLGPGIGEAKASSVAAAVELGRRLAHAQLPKRRPMDQPAAVARYLLLRYAVADQEVMGALFLDVHHRLVGEREIFRGTLCRAAVEPRTIFKAALLANASSLLLFHTHPSGDPTPSAEDVAFTRRMTVAGKVLGIPLNDHLVLGSAGRWTSLKRSGGWSS